MKKNGPASAASLSVVPITGARPALARLSCPAHLSAVAAEVWRNVTTSRPSDFFDAGAGPLLESYCVAIAEHRRVMAVVEAMQPDDADYCRLARVSDMYAARIGSCATRLRLTNQSRYRPGKAGTLAAAGGSSADRIRANYARSHDEG